MKHSRWYGEDLSRSGFGDLWKTSADDGVQKNVEKSIDVINARYTFDERSRRSCLEHLWDAIRFTRLLIWPLPAHKRNFATYKPSWRIYAADVNPRVFIECFGERRFGYQRWKIFRDRSILGKRSTLSATWLTFESRTEGLGTLNEPIYFCLEENSTEIMKKYFYTRRR